MKIVRKNVVSVIRTIAETQKFSPQDKLTKCIFDEVTELTEEELDLAAAAYGGNKPVREQGLEDMDDKKR